MSNLVLCLIWPLLDFSNAHRMFSMMCKLMFCTFLFDLSSVTNAFAMFYQCTALTTVPLFNLSNCTNALNQCFSGFTLTTVPLFDLSSVTNAGSIF